MTDRGTALRMLAKHLGVQRAWRAYDGRRRVVTDDTLLGTIRLLGVPVASRDDAGSWLERIVHAERDRMLEPVTVLWDGAPLRLSLVLPVARAADDFTVHVVAEDGTAACVSRRECRVGSPRREGPHHVTFVVEPPARLPYGVHRVGVELARAPMAWTVVIAAPAHLGDPPPGEARRWGVFVPLHGLHASDRPSGDFALLERISSWSAHAGVHAIGLLPILAAYAGHGLEPYETSPYSPVSRRFWNEQYLDLHAIPEVDTTAVGAVERRDGIGALVDPRTVAATRRPLLEAARERLLHTTEFAARREAFAQWCEQRPDAAEYAAFRGTVEAHGPIAPGAALDPSAPGADHHRYVQWLLDEQLTALRARCRARRQVLYLDLPIGAHPEGFDVWQRPREFVAGAVVGAPPDEFNPDGQQWGTPPVHPHAARLAGHSAFRADLRAHFAVAPWLRIDHVMGLHRLWIVAEGASAADGAYVTYPAEELYAIVCLEASRTSGVESDPGVVVGENLGTVPHETNRALQSHRMLGCYVAEFEHDADGLRPPGRRSLASIDTHDTMTFAQWWHDLDPEPRGALLGQLRADGLLDTELGETVDAPQVLAALLTHLGASRAEIVMVALEDLWLETDAQNEPGAGAGRTENFRRRLARSVDELERDDACLDLLREVDHVRRSGLVEV